MPGYATQDLANGVHLVGSVPLSSTSETFCKMMAALPHRLRRLPDGETGERKYFIRWQDSVFIRSPASKEAEIKLGPIGYDDAALASYKEFVRLRKEGVIEPKMRFQVCLPTPINAIAKYVRPEYQANADPVYEGLLLQAMRRIQDGIPPGDLAIQFDLAVEFAMLEGLGKFFTPWFSPLEEGIVERTLRLTGAVDQEVELGFHLCYGGNNNRHFVQPKDSGHLVDMANVLAREINRPVQWSHMPVPKDRVDTAYFEPMRQLALHDETELYLGLVHADDMQGTLEKMGVARKVISKDFGVATECGLGRTQLIDNIVEISAAASRPTWVD